MKKIAHLFAIVLLTFSCEKSTINDPAIDKEVSASIVPIVNNVTSKGGRLIFETRDDFNKTVNMLFENQNKVENFESQFSEFTSNSQAFDNFASNFKDDTSIDADAIRDFAYIKDSNGEKTLEHTIDLRLLSYLFNDKGILQIGDSVYKYTYEFTYKFNVDKLSQLKSAKLVESMDGVTAYPNVRNHFKIPESNLKSAMASVSEVSQYWQPDGSRECFMKSELNQNITYLYNALTVDTKSRKWNWLGIGVTYKVYGLYAAATGYYRWVGGEFEYLGNIPFNVGDQRTGGVTDVQQTIVSGGGISSYPTFVSATGKHWLKPYSYSQPIYANPTTSY
jgi:hypothetical protein